MRIARALLEGVLRHARAGYPDEVCGVLVGGAGRRVEHAVAVPNRETGSPRTRFEIAPEDLLRLQREARERGQVLLGYYHSHPDHPPVPSEADRRLAAEGISDGVVHLIVGVLAGGETQASAWVFRDASGAFEAEPLEVD